MSDAPKKTALLSVADITGIVEFAHGLSELGWDLVSSGLTAKTLRQAEIPVREVVELTKAADLVAGRVRLLQPRLFGGILADRSDAKQLRELEIEGIPLVELVAVNLYPLSQVLESGQMSQREAMDFLDVSGAALLRASARSFHSVIPLCDPRDYRAVLDVLAQGKGLGVEQGRRLASKAFNYISYYDSTVAQYLSDGSAESLPDELILSLKKTTELRYGENPHQGAAIYNRSGARPWGLNAADLISGRPLAFNHYLSMDRAVDLVGEFARPACAIVKFANPAGAAWAERSGEAARLAYAADPSGCTGGVAAFNREVDADAAKVLATEYIECVVAPDYTSDALDALRAKKDLRLVRLPSLLLSAREVDVKTISGGVLVQDRDNPTAPEAFKAVSKRAPSELETAALDFAWRVSKHTTTFSAVLARGTATLGVAGGQTTRLDAVRLAIVKAQERHPVISPALPTVLAADGALERREFEEAAQAGVTAVILAGGTRLDPDCVSAADDLGLALVFTGKRHYRL
ncbi:MAG: bifunctional phosphoribosylaminoimidazolecarboxamide formyltransferase/IMP cyclohydrolase [Elusimicrobia bacterium]|nr:bifunctional phosphoribosylaminoimidazolecarboxamide formyltransferase/IMP cyclohydrolase [Elusimicrobiota bacterium]